MEMNWSQPSPNIGSNSPSPRRYLASEVLATRLGLEGLNSATLISRLMQDTESRVETVLQLLIAIGIRFADRSLAGLANELPIQSSS